MKSLLALMLVLVLAGFVGAAPEGAAKEAPAKAKKSIKGEVVKVEGSNVTIKAKDKEVTIATDANTKVMIEGAEAKLSDLKAGQKVTVSPAEGTATKIEVPKPKAAKAKADKKGDAKPAAK